MAERGPDGKFIKGKSGNPGGRPATEFTLPALIDKTMSERDWLEILDRIKRKAKQGDLKAIELLMDRRWGKAKESKELTGNLLLTIDWDEPGNNAQS